MYKRQGGNGANGNALGKSVFLVNLKNGEFERCTRDHVLGVLKLSLIHIYCDYAGLPDCTWGFL